MNIFQIVCDLLDLVQDMNTQLAAHTHGPTPVPGNATAFSAHSSRAEILSGVLRAITIRAISGNKKKLIQRTSTRLASNARSRKCTGQRHGKRLAWQSEKIKWIIYENDFAVQS